MNPVLLWIAAGGLFWLGAALLGGAACFFGYGRRRLAQALLVPGWLCWLFSGVPFNWWSFAGLTVCAGLLGVPWRIAALSRTLLGMYVALLLLVAGLEARYWRMPEALPYTGSIHVIGDSISAGIGFRGEVTYVELLGTDWRNHSVGGGTVGSALRTLEQVKAGPGDVILLEIGGNDLLGGHAAAAFRQGLEALLRQSRATGARLVMLELPLPPLSQEYGRAQRELAAQYGVVLIPRWCFARVLSGEGATVDGLHLANWGHRKMAALLHPRFRAAGSEPQTNAEIQEK